MKIKEIAFYLFSTFILMLPAFYNGYPLVYSDSGTYISSGMEMFVPADRPVLYGLFIKYCSLQLSLWLVVMVQAFIVQFAIWHLCKLFNKDLKKSIYLSLLFILSWFTGLGWYCSLIMPDIFTAVAVSCAILLVFRKNWSVALQIVFSAILMFSVAVHFANIYIVAILLVGIYVFSFFFLKEERKARNLSFIVPTVVLVFAFGVKFAANYWVQRNVHSNDSSHVFVMGKMLDSGVLKSFLDDNCKNKKYAFCECKDSLPINSRVLLWNGGSPFYKHGGWLNTKQAYDEILLDIAGSPKHVCMFIYNSAFSTVTQMLQSNMSNVFVSDWYQSSDSPPYMAIAKHFPNELNPYLQSLQNNHLWVEKLDFTEINIVYKTFLVLCALLLLALVMIPSLRKMLDAKTKFLLLVLFISNFINAAIVATFANVYSRLQVRFSWLLLLACFIVISLLIEGYMNKKKL